MHKIPAAKQHLYWCRLCYPSANTLRSGKPCAIPDRWLSHPGLVPRCSRRLDATDPAHRHCTIEHINQANRPESNESGEQLETERTTPSKTTQHGIAHKASTTASFYPTCCSSITPNRSKDHRMVVVTALATPHPEPMSPPRNWRLHSRASRVQWLVKELQVVDTLVFASLGTPTRGRTHTNWA